MPHAPSSPQHGAARPGSARPAADHRLGFRTLDREVAPAPLSVEGNFPAWLAGTLLRTGPAQFEVGAQRYRHWFDGLAMLHRFAFHDGAVSYASRFVDSAAYRGARESGRITYSEFATDPCRSLFRRVVTAFQPPRFGANANVNVLRFGDEFLAMSETPLPVVFDPATLRTLGVGAPAPGQLTVAHPHRVPGSDEVVSYATKFGPATRYQVYARPAGGAGAPRVIATMPAPRPSYMHSFAITEHYAVLVEFPFVAVPLAIPLSGRPFIENFTWKPERGTGLRVVELATGRVRRTHTAEPVFAFHHVNAFERDGELVIDLCAYDDADIVQALYLDRLRTARPRHPSAHLRRYVLPPGAGEVRSQRLGDVGIELPRIDYARRNGLPYRYVYGVGGRNDGEFPNQIVKSDVDTRESTVWSRPDTYPGEPVFVRSPGDEREDGGVLLSVVLDPAAGASFLLVLDATDLTELARAWVPHAVPFGFHGNYFADQR
jgi:carotenoid cleavage dioxygenase-like enzyme